MIAKLEVYEEFVRRMWSGHYQLHLQDIRDLFICSTGLGGETGEALEKLKKMVRDGDMNTEGLKKELGDVMYYVTALSIMFGFTLGDVLQANVDKLKDRAIRNTLHGNGDDR